MPSISVRRPARHSARPFAPILPAAPRRGVPRLAGALLLASLASAPGALAHQVWLERDGSSVRAYFGEPAEDKRESTGGLLDMIGGPRILAGSGTAPLPVQRRGDHLEAALPAEAATGDVRLVEDTLKPYGAAGSPDRTRSVMLAREGRSETRATLPLELVPTAPGSSTFTVMLDNKPLPRAEVTVVAPPLWEKRLHSDAEGRVTFETPWAGRYVAEVVHVADQPGGTGEGAYRKLRYVSTLSFRTESGLPWPGK